MTALATPIARSAVDPVRAMAAYLGLELRRALRNRRYFVFAIGFPVAFYLLYTGVLQGGGGGAIAAGEGEERGFEVRARDLEVADVEVAPEQRPRRRV